MLPFLLKVFNRYESKCGTSLKFLDSYAETEFHKVFGYLNAYLDGKTFLVEERLSGADFMLGFVVQGALQMLQCGDKYPHIQRYITHIESLPSYQRALQLETN